MLDPRTLLALAGQPQQGEGNPFGSLILMALIFGIFYFVPIMPMRSKQKKVEEFQQGLKSGDQVIINPGIFGTIESVDPDFLMVRIAEKTRIKVLKSAVAGPQGSAPATENK